jgi:cytochrome c5
MPVAILTAGVSAGGCGDPGASSPPAAAGFTVVSTPARERSGPPRPDPALWETVQPDPVLERGRQVWIGTCIDCHSTGLGGAPLIGNRDVWAPRIAKGIETLVEHATDGFFGAVGEMPARGGNPSLDDEQVRAAVLFMTSRAR